MSGLAHFWSQGDAITRAVALLLLLMSVSAWVVILWKGWLLRRVRSDIARAVPAFWAAPTLDAGAKQLQAFDREAALRPLLVEVGHLPGVSGRQPIAETAEAVGLGGRSDTEEGESPFSGEVPQSIDQVGGDHGLTTRLQLGMASVRLQPCEYSHIPRTQTCANSPLRAGPLRSSSCWSLSRSLRF